MDDQKKSSRRSDSFGSTSKVQFEDNDGGKQKLSLSEGSIAEDKATYTTSPEQSESGTLKKPKRFRPKKFIQKRLKLRPKDSKSSDEINRADSEISEDSIRKSYSFSSDRGSEPTSPRLQRFSFMRKITGSGRKSYKFNSGEPSTSSQETQDSTITLTKVEHIPSSGEDQKSEVSSDGEVHIAHRSFTPSDKFFEIKEQKEENVLIEETTTVRQTTLERKKQELKITISGKKVERVVGKASPSSPQQEPMTAREQLENILLPAFAKSSRELSMERDEPISGSGDIATAATFPLTFAAVLREQPSSDKSKSASGSTRELEKYLVLTSSLNSIISAAKELDEQTTNKRISFQELIGTSKIEDFDNNVQHELLRSESSPPAVESPDSETRDRVIEEIASESNEVNVEEKFAQLVDSTGSEDEQEQPKSLSEAFTSFLKDQIHDEPEIYSSTPNKSTMSSTSDEGEKTPVESSPVQLMRSEIKFELGTPVRPQRTSPASSSLGIAPIATVDELDISHDPIAVIAAFTDDDETFHSPMSDRSDKSLQSMRRKIRYVPELSNYSNEEQELLKSNLCANSTDSLPDSSLYPQFDDTTSVRRFEYFFMPCALMCNARWNCNLKLDMLCGRVIELN